MSDSLYIEEEVEERTVVGEIALVIQWWLMYDGC